MGLAALGAGVIATVTLSPMVTHPNRVLAAYDHPGDAMVSIWSTWVRRGADSGCWSLERVPLVNAPHGINFYQNPPEPAIEWPQRWLSRLMGEVAAFNLHLWMTFPLAAATMAWFLWELTAQPAASIVGGILYACLPYHWAHTMQLSLASIQWLPLALWSWVWLAKAPGVRRALGTAVCLGLVLWSTVYYGLLLAAASIVMIVAARRWCRIAGTSYRAFLQAGLFAVVLVVLVAGWWYAPFLKTALDRYSRPMKHLFVYCAKPWDYLLPSVHHPWAGSLVKPFVSSHLYGSNIVEQTLFLGFGVLGLAAWGAIAGWRARRQDPQGFSVVLLLVSLAVIGLWFSGPPFVPLGPFRIEQDQVVARVVWYFPSALLHPLFPFFRVYARFGLLVGLAVTALAALGWARAWRLWSTRPIGLVASARGRLTTALWPVAIGLLLIADYSVAMPFRSIGSIPAVYRWLALQPGDPIVVEYPFMPSTHELHAEYLFAQRVHQKRLLNGAYERTAEGQRRLTLVDLRDPTVPANLRRLGVDLVIVHHDRYAQLPRRPTTIQVFGVTYRIPERHWDEALPPPPETLPNLRPIARFDQTVVYRLEQP